MKFGRLPVDDAEGAILAHSTRLEGGALKKGRRLNADDIARLRDSGRREIIAAQLDESDVPEDAAATRIAKAACGPNIRLAEAFTGRVNVFAETDGLAILDRERITALNRIDEGVTIATLSPHERVVAGQMVATIKIIPFAVPEAALATAERAISTGDTPLISVAAFKPHRTHLILTELPGSKPSVIAKRRDAIAKRLASAGSNLVASAVVAHETDAVANAIGDIDPNSADLILVFGASAIVDRKDVIPAGIEAAGGVVRRLGMPVDPGNLLLLGQLGDRVVIGVPSCASSPKINGLDWVLERTLAGLDVTNDDIAEMAVGGLLMEIPSRPQPREAGTIPAKRKTPKIAAIVLAAGRSTRMGEKNKLLEQIDGRALVSHAVDASAGSRAGEIYVVTGHEAERVEAELADAKVTFVHNPNYADGLATSLAAGIEALPDDIDGAVILLGDMPGVTANTIDRLIAAFNPDDSRGICVPVFDGRRGNPVLWARKYFDEMTSLSGDTGAKSLIKRHAEDMAEVAMESGAILTDIDTPEMLAQARAEAD